jgi:hypothetical protein
MNTTVTVDGVCSRDDLFNICFASDFCYLSVAEEKRSRLLLKTGEGL